MSVVGLEAMSCAAAPRPAPPSVEAAAVGVVDVAPLSDFEPTGYRSVAPDAARVEVVTSDSRAAACRFETTMWSGAVHITSGSEAFGTVDGARNARVLLPEMESQRGVPIELELSGLNFSAIVLASELELYSSRPQLFDGLIWALPGAALQPQRARAGHVEVELRLPKGLDTVRPLRARKLTCEELRIAPGDDAALPRELLGARRVVQLARFRGDARVALSSTLSGKPRAFLDTRPRGPDDEPDEVIVLEQRRDRVRIAHSRDGLVIFGWVDASALQAGLEESPIELMQSSAPAWADPIEPFGGNDPTRVEVADQPRTCAWNAPLAIEVAGELRTVGTFASGIPLLPLVTRDGWREVQFSHPGFALSESATAWVPERLLYPCTPRQ